MDSVTASASFVIADPILLKIADIRVDGGTQMRVGGLNHERVDVICSAYLDGPDEPDPVVVFRDGSVHWLADGFHRIAAATKATMVAIKCDVRIGDRRAARRFAFRSNDRHGIPYSNADKRNVVKEAIVDADELEAEGHDRLTNIEIARMCGVSHTMVNHLRPDPTRETVSRSTDEPTESIGRDEPRVPRERDDAGDPDEVHYDSDPEFVEHTFTGGTHDLDAMDYRRPADGDSWSTPDDYITDVLAVLGNIDLDPATNAAAQARIGATVHYTKEDDGLTKEWSGNVWMNPPYSQPLCSEFAAKLVAEFDAGRVTQAIMLVNNATDTKWMQPLLRRFVCCFPEGRIKFVNEANEPAMSPRDAQVFVYMGKDPRTFVRVFGPVGAVMGPL